jgi:hypothetical protein
MRGGNEAFRYNVPFQFARERTLSHYDGANRWNVPIHGVFLRGSRKFSTTFSTVSVKIL